MGVRGTSGFRLKLVRWNVLAPVPIAVMAEKALERVFVS